MTVDRFRLVTEDGAILREKCSAGALLFWLQENAFFEHNPDTRIFFEEVNTRDFRMEVTRDTSSSELSRAWNRYMNYPTDYR